MIMSRKTDGGVRLNDRRPDLLGAQFGRLTVIAKAGSDYQGQIWRCHCICGKEITVSTRSLRSGHTRSCGCMRRERLIELRTTHGMSKNGIYAVWGAMKARCLKPGCKDFKYYGARGVTVSEEWQKSFAAFYEHVSKLPHYGEEGYSLDRKDNNGNYEPGNVRWATASEQALNRRKRGTA